MIVAESRLGRRLVGRLEKGSDLLEGLSELCRDRTVRAAEIRAFGALEEAVVVEYNQRARGYRPPRRFESQLELLSLYGNLSERDGKANIRVHATLSRERDNGIELLGGLLISGRVFAVEFVIDVFDDLLLRRYDDAATGLPLWKEAIAQSEAPLEAPLLDKAAPPPAATVATPGEKPDWQEVITVSNQPAPIYAAEVQIRPGDLIEHPKFGRCQVERVEGEHEFVSARLRNQRLIRLSLEILALEFVGEEEGRRLFRAVAQAR